MVHPVIFKDRCSCGGYLYNVNSRGDMADSSDEICSMRCKSCRTDYFVSWDITTGEPKPLLSKDEAIKQFMSDYAKSD